MLYTLERKEWQLVNTYVLACFFRNPISLHYMCLIATVDATSWFVYSLVRSFSADLVSSIIVIVVVAIALRLVIFLAGWLWNTKWRMMEDMLHFVVMAVLGLVCMASALVMNGVTGGGLLSGDTGVLTSALKLSSAPDKVQWVEKAAGSESDAEGTPTRRPSRSTAYTAEDAALARQIMALNEQQNGKNLKLTEVFVKEAAASVSKAFNMASTLMILSFVLLLLFVSWSSYSKIKTVVPVSHH